MYVVMRRVLHTAQIQTVASITLKNISLDFLKNSINCSLCTQQRVFGKRQQSTVAFNCIKQTLSSVQVQIQTTISHILRNPHFNLKCSCVKI